MVRSGHKDRAGTQAWVVAVCLLFAAPLTAQEPEPALERLPLARWLERGELEQIRWKVALAQPRLSIHQRMRTTVAVEMDGKQLQKSSVQRDLFLVVKVGDGKGLWYPGEGTRHGEITDRLGRGSVALLDVSMFIRPGQYAVAIVLYDRITGERSQTRRTLRVPRPGGERLEGGDLPVVEFLEAHDSPERFFLPESRALRLPVASRRPLRIEVLANFTPSDQYTGSRRVQEVNLSYLLPIVKLLSEMRVQDGSVTVTALDLDQQRVFFQEQHTRRLDWPRLKEALDTLRPTAVSVQSLQGRRQQAAFFRDILWRSVNESGPAEPGNGAGDRVRSETEPYRIFIVVGSGVLFPRGSDRRPLPPVEDCHCRVYYLRHRAWFGNLWDELEGIMKPLKPRRFTIESPADLRKALAEILRELRSL